MQNYLEDMIKSIAVITGYEDKGVDAYYDIVEETDDVKKQYEEMSKEIGEKRTKMMLIMSKIEILTQFIELKKITDNDINILIDELCSLSKELYELKGE